jgi:hypothetical protein
LLNLPAQEADIAGFAGRHRSMNEVGGANGSCSILVSKMLAKAGGSILKCEIAGGPFDVKCGDRGVGASVIVEQGIEQIERILWCLPAREGAQLVALPHVKSYY